MAKVTTAKSMEAAVQELLAAPFAPEEVRWKAQAARDNRALAVAYVDARAVMDRLDEVLGVQNWQDRYETLADGSVSCRLRVRFGSEWITKEDVGGQSEQPDEGDRHKAAFSDALKRAAVKFGVGRYLYRLPKQWVDYDPQRKQLKAAPQLPEWAMPGYKPPRSKSMPRDGVELKRRLVERGLALAEAGRCGPGDLLAFVAKAGARAGHPEDVTLWDEYGIALAAKAAREFEAKTPPQPVLAPAKGVAS
jgi:hypothetical protein